MTFVLVAFGKQDKLQVAAAAAQQAAILRGQPFDANEIVLDEPMPAMTTVHSPPGQSLICNQQQLQIQSSPVAVNTSQADVTRVEYFAVPTTGTGQVPSLAVQHASGLQFQYQQYQLTTGIFYFLRRQLFLQPFFLKNKK